MNLVPAGIRDDSNRALDACAARVHGLGLTPLLTDLVDAAGEDVLPHLAAQFHILHTVAWRRASNPTVRRGLIKTAMRRHRIKGSRAGFNLAASDADCAVVAAVTPPAKAYPSPAMTRDERNAFVARYPQLRMYRHRTLGRRIGLHCGDALGRWLPVQSDAALRIAPRAYLWRQGEESELTVIERATASSERIAERVLVTEVAIPGAAGRLSFVGAIPRFLTVTEAARRFYRLTMSQPYMDSSETLRRVAVSPGLTPIDVRPEAIAWPGQAAGVHAGQFVARFLAASTASDRIYQRLYLFDPDIEVVRRAATLHMGAARLGMPAHHAELAVRVPGCASPQAAGRYCRGHLVAAAKANLADCLEAMRDVARASDRVAVDTRIKRPVAAGESAIAGQTLAGDWITI